MRVTFSASHYAPFALGGSAESVRLSAEGLGAAGHEVTLVTPRWGEAPEVEAVNGVRIIRAPVLSTRATQSVPTSDRAYGPRFLWGMTARLWSVGRDADLLHAQDHRTLLPVVLVARLLGKPAVATLRDTGLLCPIATCLLTHRTVPADCGQQRLWQTCAPEYRRLYGLRVRGLRTKLAWGYLQRRLTVRWAVPRLRVLGFVSDGLRQVYAHAGVCGQTPTAVWPSPVSDTRASTVVEKFEKLALYVGKPSLGKGWPAFVDAALVMAQFGSGEAFFFQIGPHPAPGDRIASIANFGPMLHWDVFAWMRIATVVCVPSVTPDALPRVALEACAQETPVIGTRVGGLPEIIRDGETGWLVGPGASLVPAIRQALDDPERTRAMGQRARADVLTRFGVQTTTQRLVAGYEEVLG